MPNKPYESDWRLRHTTRLLPPSLACDKVPLGPSQAALVVRQRTAIARALRGEAPQLVVVVGPCSIHDPAAATEYAGRLHDLSGRLGGELLVVMRTYFEKPRTSVGWKGLVNDPRLDGSFDVASGLLLARQVLCAVCKLGLATACEFLDAIGPQYLADAICWGAIGARTCESQAHRALASGLSMPMGFKNSTEGNVQSAVHGVLAAAQPQAFLGIDNDGAAAMVVTAGNSDCHIVLRGGRSGPNYGPDAVVAARQALLRAGLRPFLMVDASHNNSDRDPQKALQVIDALAAQIHGGEAAIAGIMFESFLEAGNQPLTPGGTLRFGQSITDPCLGWADTEAALTALAAAAKRRRAA